MLTFSMASRAGSVLGLAIRGHIERAGTVDTDAVVACEAAADDERQSALRIGGKGVRIRRWRDTWKRNKQTLIVAADGNRRHSAAAWLPTSSRISARSVCKATRLGRDFHGLRELADRQDDIAFALLLRARRRTPVIAAGLKRRRGHRDVIGSRRHRWKVIYAGRVGGGVASEVGCLLPRHNFRVGNCRLAGVGYVSGNAALEQLRLESTNNR